MQKIKLNKLPAPTFGSAGVNYIEIEQRVYTAASPEAELPDGVVLTEREGVLTFKGSSEEPVRIELHPEQAQQARLRFEVPSDGHLEAIIWCTAEGSALVEAEADIPERAKLSLVEVIEGGEVVNKASASLEENAGCDIVQLFIGGSTVSETAVKLLGRRSEFTSAVGYTLDGTDSLAVNIVADHYGKKSSSDIIVKGILDGESSKVFCGTIDLKQGASGAKGRENEDVLLMSDGVRNRTVPLILCSEEDVEGAHGASAGKLDEDEVFYLRSRGLPTDRIYELMARAKLGQVARRITDAKTYARVSRRLPGGVEDE